MTSFREVFGSNSETTLNFFFQHLKDHTEKYKVRTDETLYVSSILAHYAQTSCSSPEHMPPLMSLSDIFDNFILPSFDGTVSFADSEIMEIAASQSLFLAGFFRDQMKKRHNIAWYDNWGSHFYQNAAFECQVQKRAELLGRMSSNFRTWAIMCRDLNRYFRDRPYLIRIEN